MRSERGFTLVQLAVFVALVWAVISVVSVFASDSAEKNRDTKRQAQLKEFVKAAELYFADNGVYPNDNDVDPGINTIRNSTGFLRNEGGYIGRLAEDPIFDTANGYQYCASDDQDSMTILIHLETGGGGYCYYSTGPDDRVEYCGNGHLTSLPVTDACINRI